MLGQSSFENLQTVTVSINLCLMTGIGSCHMSARRCHQGPGKNCRRQGPGMLAVLRGPSAQVSESAQTGAARKSRCTWNAGAPAIIDYRLKPCVTCGPTMGVWAEQARPLRWWERSGPSKLGPYGRASRPSAPMTPRALRITDPTS